MVISEGEVLVMNKYKEEIKKCIEDLKHKDTFYKQIPNLLTFSRAVGAPFISAMFITGHLVIGVVSTVLLLSTDLFDGRLARKWNVQSKFGADLDAFCDKIMFLGLSLPLLISNPLVLLNFIMEGAISGVNVLGRINGLDTKTVFSGKVKTCFLSLMLGIGYMVQFLNVPVSLLKVLVGITFISQGFAFANYVIEYNKMKKIKLNEKNIELHSNDEEKLEKEEVLIEDKSLVEDLSYEKDLILGSLEPDKKEETKVRKRVFGKRN